MHIVMLGLPVLRHAVLFLPVLAAVIRAQSNPGWDDVPEIEMESKCSYERYQLPGYSNTVLTLRLSPGEWNAKQMCDLETWGLLVELGSSRTDTIVYRGELDPGTGDCVYKAEGPKLRDLFDTFRCFVRGKMVLDEWCVSIRSPCSCLWVGGKGS